MTTQEKPSLPSPTEIFKTMLSCGVLYRYNMLCQAHEFNINGVWTMDDAHARAVIRESGEIIIPSIWQDALRLVQGWPAYKWHPWKDVEGTLDLDDSEIHWIIYATIQRVMLEHPPQQPIFVHTPTEYGALTPVDMTEYEPAIFHRISAGADGGRGRMVADARRSKKVAVMPTRRASEYINDERFYICGEIDTSPLIWEKMFKFYQLNKYRVAMPEIDEDDDEDDTTPLPHPDQVVQDIEAAYLETRSPFSIYSIMADLYWEDVPLASADKVLRTRYSQTVKRVTELLKMAGYIKSARNKWSNVELLVDLSNEQAQPRCHHDVTVPPGWQLEPVPGKNPAGGKCTKCGHQVPLYPSEVAA